MPTSSPATCTSGTVPPGTTLATSKVQKATRVTKVIQVTQGKMAHQANQDNQGSIEALKEERATLTASLKAANQEIDKLTKPTAKRQQKKDAADTKE